MDEDGFSYIEYIFGPIILTLAVITFVSNILLCILIFISKNLRQYVRYWFIVGTSVCDLFTGVVSCLWVSSNYGTVHHTCGSLILVTAFGSYAMEFINFWYLTIINIEYCTRLFQCRTPRLSPLGRIFGKLTLTLLPWIGACLVVSLGVQFGLHHYAEFSWQFGHCPVVLTHTASLSIKVVSCLLPGVITLLVLGVMSCKYLSWNRVGTYAQMTSRLLNDDSDEIMDTPFCYIVASLVTIICSAPIEIFGLVMDEIKDLRALIITSFIVGTILILKAAVLPYVWLLLSELRIEIKKKANLRQETGRATYRRFPEQHDSGEVTISHSEDEQVPEFGN